MKKLVLLFAALLVAGCGEKSSSEGSESVSEEPSDTPNSLSDADVERLLKEAVEFDSLQERGDLRHQVNESEPYSGWAKEMWDSGQVEALVQFKDGKMEGLHTWWHENGQKMGEGTAKDGKPDGLYMLWHENGQKKQESTYKDGKEDGLRTQWHENGQKWLEKTFKDGAWLGGSEKYWNSKGEEVETRKEAQGSDSTGENPSAPNQPSPEAKAESKPESAPESRELPPLPETVTAEFIVGLWAKPHDERDFIEELKDDKPGIWKFVRNIGPRKGELVQRHEASVTLKWVDRRFVAQEFSDDAGVQYSVTTYDYETESYRWWSLQPDGFITESSGKRYWRNLREWKSVRLPEEDMQFRMRETVRGEKSFKVTLEIKQGGELVAYAEDEGTWVKELGPPEEAQEEE